MSEETFSSAPPSLPSAATVSVAPSAGSPWLATARPWASTSAARTLSSASALMVAKTSSSVARSFRSRCASVTITRSRSRRKRVASAAPSASPASAARISSRPKPRAARASRSAATAGRALITRWAYWERRRVRSSAERNGCGTRRAMVRRYNKPQNTEDRRIKALPRIVFRLAPGIAAFLLVALAAVLLWVRYVALPNIDQYRDDIVASIEKASGMKVSARRLTGAWQGLRPRVSLEGFAIADRNGRVALALERAEVTISWWTLLAGQFRFQDVDFYHPELHLRRGADGLIYLADKPLNEAGPGEGAFTEWLLAQPSLGIHEAVLIWRDEKANVSEVRLDRVEIEVRKHLSRHRAVLTAAPPRELARRLELRADVRLHREDTHWKAAGEVFLDAVDADLGNLRVWVSFATDGLREVVADLNMRDANVQLAADALALELATISGRAAYTAHRDGFSLATEGLRFRLASGAEARPGNFSVMRTEQAGSAPRTELRADGIDLKIATTLIEYFPVPRDVKAQVLRFAPRGRIADASLGWTGDTAKTMGQYAVKGRFEDLAINAVDTFPGVTGLSGRIEGSEAGGTVELDSRNATFALERFFRAPLAFDTLKARATWRHAGRVLEVAAPEARFANADAEGTLAGTWHSIPDGRERSPGYVDVKGNLTRALASRVAAYLPNTIAPTRDWLEKAVQSGSSSRVAFELKGDLYDFPFGDGSGRFLFEGDIRDGRLQYHPA